MKRLIINNMGLLYLLACIILIIVIVVLVVVYIIPEIRSGAFGTVQPQQSTGYENLVNAEPMARDVPCPDPNAERHRPMNYAYAQEERQGPALDWHPILITPSPIAPHYTPEQIAQLQEWFGR